MKKSKRHYSWWEYIKEIVRAYPLYNKTPCSGISPVEMKNWKAVQEAVTSLEHMDGGAARLKVIRMVHWDRTHKLEGAALEIPCSRSLAAKWQREFFEEVARNRGLLD